VLYKCRSIKIKINIHNRENVHWRPHTQVYEDRTHKSMNTTHKSMKTAHTSLQYRYTAFIEDQQRSNIMHIENTIPINYGHMRFSARGFTVSKKLFIMELPYHAMNCIEYKLGRDANVVDLHIP
jgi:hypothetical protein